MKELSVKLTVDQREALDKMIEWVNKPIKNPSDLFYVLTGFAGTGKSFILKHFIEQSGIRNLVVTAPTHKAKKVISKFTELPSKTIQSLLGLRPDVNMEFFDINKPVFNPLADETIKEYRYVFIDESSMINKDSYELIIKRATRYKIRVVFMGDSYQLPPVNEHISRVFTDVKNKSELTTIVRQEESNPNINVLNLIRQDIRYNTNKALQYIYKYPSMINEKGEGYLALQPHNFTKALINKFCKTEAMYDSDYIKYIAYTNRSVAAACKGIRSKRIGERSSELIVKEDFLLGYNTIMKESKDMFYTVLENSEDYTIDNIQDCTSDFGINCYGVNLIDSTDIKSFVYIVKRESYEDFLQIFRSKLNIAKEKRGRYWEYYYKFKNEHLLMEDMYFPNTNRLEVKKDLYYGYGITTHKSQGSTYSNVAINVKDILRVRNVKERNKLLYVALSRTSKLNILNI